MTDSLILVYAALLSWVMLIVAALLRTRAGAGGLAAAFGNRHDLAEPSPLAGRAERAARNMLEGMILFVALLVAAHIGDASQDRIDLGASIFFFARVAYFPIYLAGITHVRTAVWVVSLIGLGIIATA